MFSPHKFGERFENALKSRGFSVREFIRKIELSEHLGDSKIFSDTTVRNWKDGRNIPSIEHLRVISKVLGVSIDYLLDNNGEDPIKAFHDLFNSYLKRHGCESEIKPIKTSSGNAVKYLTSKEINEQSHKIMDIVIKPPAFPHDMYTIQEPSKVQQNSLNQESCMSSYVMVGGNIYPAEHYHKYAEVILNDFESVYDIVNDESPQSLLRIKSIRNSYNKNRASLGVLGIIGAGNFILLCYALGYYSKK